VANKIKKFIKEKDKFDCNEMRAAFAALIAA